MKVFLAIWKSSTLNPLYFNATLWYFPTTVPIANLFAASSSLNLLNNSN